MASYSDSLNLLDSTKRKLYSLDKYSSTPPGAFGKRAEKP